MKKLMLAMLAAVLLMGLGPVRALANESEFADTTVILITHNLRGQVQYLPYVAAARAYFEAQGAAVVLADGGNFLQGTRYAAFNSGSTVVTLMAAAGYDVLALGVYDFAFGAGTMGTAFHGDAIDFGPLGDLLEAQPSLAAVASNISGANEFFHSFESHSVVTLASGATVGFVGITCPTVTDYVLEASLAGLRIESPTRTLVAQANAPARLRADWTIVLGNTAGTLPYYPGFIAVNHAPTAIPGSPVVTVLVLCNDTHVLLNDMPGLDITAFDPCPVLTESVNDFRAVVAEELPVLARLYTTLDGRMATNRGGATNLGNLWTNALRWFAVYGGMEDFFHEDDIAMGNNRLHVPPQNVVALWNAGNLRDFLHPGDVTLHDLRRVLPFPNTVAVVYLTGAELLEQLEASGQGLPYDPANITLTAAFMHVAGIEYVVDTAVPFDGGEAYRDRVWRVANSVQRTTITSINGQLWQPDAMYAVITSNANFNGMDISYVMAARPSDVENWSTITTARVVEHAVAGYIAQLGRAAQLQNYAVAQPRITVLAPRDYVTRAQALDIVHGLQGRPEAISGNAIPYFNDVPPTHPYFAAVRHAQRTQLVGGVGNHYFAPDEYFTRQEFAVLLRRRLPGFSTGMLRPVELDFADADDIAPWARQYVQWATSSVRPYLLPPVTAELFDPLGRVTRQEIETAFALSPGATP